MITDWQYLCYDRNVCLFVSLLVCIVYKVVSYLPLCNLLLLSQLFWIKCTLLCKTWLVTPPSPRLTARPPSSSPGALGGDWWSRDTPRTCPVGLSPRRGAIKLSSTARPVKSVTVDHLAGCKCEGCRDDRFARADSTERGGKWVRIIRSRIVEL